MTSQRVMPGVEDLTGRQFNRVQIDSLVSRYPATRWAVHCVRCGTRWIEDHARVRYVGCRNTSCGRTPSGPRSTLAQTSQRVTATRSRDSEAAREYERQSAKPVIRWAAQPSEAWMLNADPSSVRAYLDYVERK